MSLKDSDSDISDSSRVSNIKYYTFIILILVIIYSRINQMNYLCLFVANLRCLNNLRSADRQEPRRSPGHVNQYIN